MPMTKRRAVDPQMRQTLYAGLFACGVILTLFSLLGLSVAVLDWRSCSEGCDHLLPAVIVIVLVLGCCATLAVLGWRGLRRGARG